MYAIIFTDKQELIENARSNGAQVVIINHTQNSISMPNSENKRPETLISDFLANTLSVPVDFAGFLYLKTIFEKSLIEAGFERQPMISTVYSYCAKEHNVSVSQVERAIRYAIHVAYDKRDVEKYFSVLNTNDICNTCKFIRTAINYFKNHIV